MSLPKTTPMRTVEGHVSVPTVGFGTYAPGDTSWCYEATLHALKAGYRHLDCAWEYGVDEAVGAAIRDSGVPREDIFITSKFWCQFGAPENVEKCLDLVLKNMGLGYLDLFLAHWPVSLQARENIASARAFENATPAERGEATDTSGNVIIDWEHSCESIAAANGKTGRYKPTWRAMQALVSKGRVRAVGVSNFSIQQLHEILSVGGDVPLSCNQVEAHPWFPNTELIDFMRKEGILATAYAPFAPREDGGPLLLKDPEIERLAKKNSMGLGQLLQSWAVQRGTVPLGKSQTPDRIRANLAVAKLPSEDFERMNNMSKGEAGRTVSGPPWGIKFF